VCPEASARRGFARVTFAHVGRWCPWHLTQETIPHAEDPDDRCDDAFGR
jgi:hypothetical protein